MARPRLTKHQRWTLDRLTRLSRFGEHLYWVLEKDCGAAGALDHLRAKGYVEVEVRLGPRGGEHRYYRPVEVAS